MRTYSFSSGSSGLKRRRALALLLSCGILPVAACESEPPNTTDRRSPSTNDDAEDDAEDDSEDDQASTKDAGVKKDASAKKDAGSIDASSTAGGAIDAGSSGVDAGAGGNPKADGSTADGDGGTQRPGLTCTGGQVPVNGKCVDRKLPDQLGPGWVQIDPGPPTTCVYGEPYSFSVRKGKVNKLLVFLAGGGACWDEASCNLPIYSLSATAPGTSGIFDFDNAENPFKDWYLVYAPYCSGDVFLGDSTQQWGGDTVQFKGFVNMAAVKNWIYENVTAPEFVFVSGCSAGAVGVALHGGYMAKAYMDNPEVDAAMVTDSFQGIITDGFPGMVNWNVTANFPEWLPMLKSIKAPYPGDTMKRGLKEALALPEFSRFTAANFNFADDSVQGLYYGFMGGDATQIGTLISEAVHDVAASAPNNYRYFTTPGTTHCIFEDDGVYGIETKGERLIDWLGKVANNTDVKSVE